MHNKFTFYFFDKNPQDNGKDHMTIFTLVSESLDTPWKWLATKYARVIENARVYEF